MATKCPNCGLKITGKLNFCTSCGTNLKTGEKTLANELEGISKSKAAKNNYEDRYNNSPAPENEQSYNNNVPPPAPPAPAPSAPRPRFKSSVVTPKNENYSSPADNASAYKAPAAEPAVTPEPDYNKAPIPTFENGFNTGEISSSTPYPQVPDNAYETNVLIEEDNVEKLASPIQNDIPAPASPEPVQDEPEEPVDETASAVNDIEAAFANLGKAKPLPKSKPAKAPAPAPEPIPEEVYEPETTVMEMPEKSEPEPEAEDYSDDSDTIIMEEPESVPAMLKVVSCVGIDSKTAEAMLARAGFQYEVVTRNDDRILSGCVIEQSHRAGDVVPADTVIKIIVSCGTWSEWSETEPDDDGNEVESVTKYRTRTREKTVEHQTSTISEVMNGYALTEIEKGFGDWVIEDYYTTEARKTSEACEAVENLIGFKYCGWFYKGTSAIERNACCSIETALYFNKDTSAADWEYREIISYSNVRETVVAWSPISEIEISETPAGDKVRSNIHMVAYKVDGVDYPLKYGSFEAQWYKYKTRTINGTTYHFEREVYTPWSVWNEWTEEPQEENEFVEVETKVLYRYRTVADEE